MTNVLGALLALVILADVRGPQVVLSVSMGVGQPAARPNFSGEWKINVAKSTFGPLPPPTVMTRSITHTEPALTIVEEQQSAMGDQKTTRKYVTDGSEITFDVAGAVVASSAVWKDATLFVSSRVDAIGISFDDRMTLSADGRTLTSVVRITSAQGAADITVVFDKQ